MSQTDPQPSFGENTDTAFEAMMAGVFGEAPALEEEFRTLDTRRAIEQRTAEKESRVVNYLQNRISDVASLQRMLISLYVSGDHHPTCEKLSAVLEEMAGDDEYKEMPDEFIVGIVRMQKYALLIPQIARSETLDVQLSADDVLNEIMQEEMFTPEEREALVDAAQLFMKSEK